MEAAEFDLRHLSDRQVTDLHKGVEIERTARARRDGLLGDATTDGSKDAAPSRAMTAGAGIGQQVNEGLTLENVENAFRYHPWNAYQVQCGDQVRDALVAAAKAILRNVPPGPDRSAALRKLREARMDANSAITHGGRF